eukprot:9581004-Lingulodinium_polyedra.AAC.1
MHVTAVVCLPFVGVDLHARRGPTPRPTPPCWYPCLQQARRRTRCSTTSAYGQPPAQAGDIVLTPVWS